MRDAITSKTIVGAVEFMTKKCFLSFSAELHEESLIIDLNIEGIVSEIMKDVGMLEKVDDLTVVLKIGPHSIKFSKEVEVTKIVKTKGYVISS